MLKYKKTHTWSSFETPVAAAPPPPATKICRLPRVLITKAGIEISAKTGGLGFFDHDIILIISKFFAALGLNKLDVDQSIQKCLL